MDDPDDQPRPVPPGLRQVARIVLPVFAASTLVVAVGFVLAFAHHRTLGLILVILGAVGGFAVRTRLMMRSQQGRRPPW